MGDIYPACALCGGSERRRDHPQVHLVAGGVQACVDVAIAPLLAELWVRGCQTEFSCQGGPGDDTSIVFWTPESLELALSFCDELAELSTDETLRRRVRLRSPLLTEPASVPWQISVGTRFWWKADADQRERPRNQPPGFLHYVLEFPAADLALLCSLISGARQWELPTPC